MAANGMRTIQHWIGGKAYEGRSGRHGDVWDPAIGEIQARVNLATRAEVELAIDTAAAAFPDWAATIPVRRARVMFKFKELVEQHAGDLAAMLTAEHGKTIGDAKGE